MGNKDMMRIMGLDVGSHTIGIAISDELGLTAQGLKTLRRKSMEDDLQEISTIIGQFEINRIVVGLPKSRSIGAAVGSPGGTTSIIAEPAPNATY